MNRLDKITKSIINQFAKIFPHVDDLLLDINCQTNCNVENLSYFRLFFFQLIDCLQFVCFVSRAEISADLLQALSSVLNNGLEFK